MALPLVINLLIGGAMGLAAHEITKSNKDDSDENLTSDHVRSNRKRRVRGRNDSSSATEQNELVDDNGDESSETGGTRSEDSGGNRRDKSDTGGEVETDDAEENDDENDVEDNGAEVEDDEDTAQDENNEES